ncbi:hypothetical protein BL250_04820 [Erwinia sp. OLTSP20]|uniref:phosphatase PAP2 family protein n=1 Tax=unclassified Erwinia TaxID=2622719 RepID=UPI000C1916B1|nr:MULTISPECIES: phosphatase PAP2 family protein [unclassified Erwinia]PIJ49448.1 hypothetical protein BV501_12725 [Erwinia sp. OAMSP11]PIJ68979.1 hypothetical protein BK416_15605 [Erwinia sp. OLSSP12]PIJ80979.1 hypothetical protein BLD46_13520 [Erwinia sp. OLMTSP26]PIJ83382.1 hypothetical protein BLD49_13205 [Erwinia sp. OLMDSP33]PIJ84295.1 hypothetical protein BLD47_02840 [Erwinia sp. OLCASP19]
MTAKRLSLILLLNVAGITLYLSWYLPAGHGAWFLVDKDIFFWFNNRLITNKPLLWYIAITNYRAFDGVSLLAMGGLYYYYWRQQTSEGRRRMFSIGITMLITAVVLNQLGHLLPGHRPSPTEFFPQVNHVAELTGIPAKDASANSFPGDHGLMLIIFTGYMLRYFGRSAFVISVIIVLFFSLPRVMIGAHWFSDIAVGSMSIALVFLSWVLLTPASDRLVRWVYRYLPAKLLSANNH